MFTRIPGARRGLAVHALLAAGLASQLLLSLVIGDDAFAAGPPIPVPVPITGGSLQRLHAQQSFSPSGGATRSARAVPTGTWQALGPAPSGAPFLAGGGF